MFPAIRLKNLSYSATFIDNDTKTQKEGLLGYLCGLFAELEKGCPYFKICLLSLLNPITHGCFSWSLWEKKTE
jgi:hypothetical protein